MPVKHEDILPIPMSSHRSTEVNGSSWRSAKCLLSVSSEVSLSIVVKNSFVPSYLSVLPVLFFFFLFKPGPCVTALKCACG